MQKLQVFCVVHLMIANAEVQQHKNHCTHNLIFHFNAIKHYLTLPIVAKNIISLIYDATELTQPRTAESTFTFEMEKERDECSFTGIGYKAVLRFGEFCCCCC